MRLLKSALAISLITIAATTAHAGDVFVNGYHRSDGTYVRPHVRSAPDGIKSNNYGPSRDSSELMAPRTRDSDEDGVPNYRDRDDDDDGLDDDRDEDQYDNEEVE
ncbi:MAG: hypothetical protein ACKV2Q_20430 [Planctomycetaceae bacterium]